jgi:hypothetical protein
MQKNGPCIEIKFKKYVFHMHEPCGKIETYTPLSLKCFCYDVMTSRDRDAEAFSYPDSSG